MKHVLKVGALALALGFFATSCNSGNTGAANTDSIETEMNAPSDQQIAPDTSLAVPDTSAAVDTAVNQ